MVKEKFKTLLSKCENKKLEFETAAMAAIATMPFTTYAGNEATTKVIGLLDVIIDIFPAIGIGLALIGAFKLFMAFRNDQPDAYSGAIKDVAIGVVLIAFKTLIWGTLKTMV